MMRRTKHCALDYYHQADTLLTFLSTDFRSILLFLSLWCLCLMEYAVFVLFNKYFSKCTTFHTCFSYPSIQSAYSHTYILFSARTTYISVLTDPYGDHTSHSE